MHKDELNKSRKRGNKYTKAVEKMHKMDAYGA